MKKTVFNQVKRGFTLVELLVVMVIMGVLMTMAASVLQSAGKGRGMETAVQQLESLIREARATAIGNDCPTRIVIVNDERDASPQSGHLRSLSVMMYRTTERAAGEYDASSLTRGGKWRTISNINLAPGVYFSPHYSRPLEWSDDVKDESMLGQDSMTLPGMGTTRVYYIEFDEKGRFVSPSADPINVTGPQRVVLMTGERSKAKGSYDGIKAKNLDNRGRPAGAKGVVIWPTGDTSRLRTMDQIEKS